MSRISYLSHTCAMLLACAVATPALAQDKVELVIANSQWLDALRGENLWNVVKLYEEHAPDVTLKSLGVPSHDYGNRMITEFGAGQGPDIAILQDEVFFALADGGLLVDVGAAAAGVEMNVTREGAIVDGVTLGIPWQR